MNREIYKRKSIRKKPKEGGYIVFGLVQKKNCDRAGGCKIFAMLNCGFSAHRAEYFVLKNKNVANMAT